MFMISEGTQNYDFHRRQDILSRLDDTLFSTTGSECQTYNTRLRSCVICGMGSIGKPELTIQYVFSRKDKFDAVFWVNADRLGFFEMSRNLGLEDQKVSKDDI
jgi:hypothetical protein